jgi:hypothetical protein
MFSMEQMMMAVVRFVADDFHFVLFPAEQALIDQNLGVGRGSETRAADLFIFLDIVRHAAAGAAEREGRPDDGWQANRFQRVHGALEAGDTVILAFFVARRRHDGRARVFQANPVHGLAEQGAVLSHLDGSSAGADELHAMLLEDPGIVQVQRAIQRRLSAHGG